MEKETLIEKSDNLTYIEKAVIEVELEKKLTHELLEAKEKDEFLETTTDSSLFETTSAKNNLQEDLTMNYNETNVEVLEEKIEDLIDSIGKDLPNQGKIIRNGHRHSY